MSWPISRVLSWVIIHLNVLSPIRFSNQPGSHAGHMIRIPIWSCSKWGLPCHCCYQQRGALLPHHFTLTLRRYIFCGTFRRLTSPRRYLALYPMEPGLSSGKTSDYLVNSMGSISKSRKTISYFFLNSGKDVTRWFNESSIVFWSLRLEERFLLNNFTGVSPEDKELSLSLWSLVLLEVSLSYKKEKEARDNWTALVFSGASI